MYILLSEYHYNQFELSINHMFIALAVSCESARSDSW